MSAVSSPPPVASEPGRRATPFPQRSFELRCADVHPCDCDMVLTGATPSDAVEAAREHGMRVHGFTPVFYRRERIAEMSSVVSQR